MGTSIIMETLANRNNNPGNLKDPSTGHFRTFGTPQEGYAALMNDLEIKKSGKSKTGLRPDSTLVDFSKAYAPKSDKNDPAQYTANVANHMGVRPDSRLKDLDVGKWADAIAHSEGYKGQASATPQPTETAPVTEDKPEYKPLFKAEDNDNPLTAGLKATANTIPSAINFGKGILHSLNPVNTLKNIAQIPETYREAKEANGGSGATAIGSAIISAPGEAYKAVVPTGVRQLVSGDLQGATKTFEEDPFGQAAPLVFAAEGGAKLADNIASKNAMSGYVDNIGKNVREGVPIPKPTTKYSGLFNKTVETVASPVTKPAGAVLGKLGDVSGGVAASIVSRLSGLEPETIKQILSDPKSFSKLERENTSRGGLAGDVQSAIEGRLEDLSEVGKGYDDVRKSNQTVSVPPKFVETVLNKSGLRIKNGKIIADTNSVTRNTADLNALNKFYKDWGKKTSLTPNEFLNMRSDIAELSKFDKVTGMGKTRASETIGKSLYEQANSTMRDTQLEELKALDDTYAPERTFLQQVKKDFFNSDGTPKDNIASKIANAGNKAELLKRLEGVIPGITKRVQVLKAVEDIERASGNKVGTYGRVITGVGGYAAGGVIGALVAEILTSPEMAVPILQKAGYIGEKSVPVIRALKAFSGDVNGKKGLISIGRNQNS